MRKVTDDALGVVPINPCSRLLQAQKEFGPLHTHAIVVSIV